MSARLILLEALTPLHPGSGRGSAYVDLPVQRDEFGFPTIWSSSLKGALRSTLTSSCNGNNDAVERAKCRRKVYLVFGPETNEASDYASAISILDARLVLIPARSLRGVWTYVTSPHLLNYLLTYMEVVNHGERDDLGKLVEQVKGVVKDGTIIISRPDLLVSGNSIVINELELGATQDATLNQLIDLLPGDVKNIANERGLVVVSDNDVQEVVRRSLIVQPRIRLNYATKTVSGSALWEEEYIPQFTVLATTLHCREIRVDVNEKLNDWKDKDCKDLKDDEKQRCVSELESFLRGKSNDLKNAGKVCDEVLSDLRPKSLFFGGKETIGKGLAKIIEW
ncbi:MAG: type III-B CRISPR module RAMP protein Cmr4 [Thermocladium sp.]